MPMDVTLYWDRDTTRAASMLLAALMRHVMGFQRVRLAPKSAPLPKYYYTEELLISLAMVFEDEYQANAKMLPGFQMTSCGVSFVPSRLRLHAWLTPAARSRSDCRSTNWTFYSNLTTLSDCGFINDLLYSSLRDNSMGAMEVLGVGDDCKPTMQRLLRRAEAAGIPARPIFVSRNDFKHKLLTSKYSFLFIDFDIWHGEPSVSVVGPLPCVSDSGDGVCQSELDNSIGKLAVGHRIMEYNDDLLQLVKYFKPTSESLRAILEQEANGSNLEEAACEWIENSKSYFSETFPEYNLKFTNIFPKTAVVIYECYDDPDNYSYDKILVSIGKKIIREYRDMKIKIVRYFVNCSDPEHMGRRLDELMQGSDGPNVLGVVSLTMEGAMAASRVAAAHHVPLLLAAAAADQDVHGTSTWLAAGRLRHVVLALHNFISQSGWTRVAVLSQPTKSAQHFYTELQDKAKFFLRNFEIQLDLTEQLVKVALQDLQATKTRVVLVNTDSDTAAFILATAVKLNMSYTDGFIWILREPLNRPESSTIHFTVSLTNKVGANGVNSVALANALITVESGFYNIFQQHPNMLKNLRSKHVVRALDDSLSETSVAGFNGEQIHYKERAIEEVYVYVDKWGGRLYNTQRLATWRVNARSGSVRDQDGSQPTLSHSNSSDAVGGSDGEVVGKQHITTTNTPQKTSNTAFVVRQWIQSITKIETSKSGLSDSDMLKFF